MTGYDDLASYGLSEKRVLRLAMMVRAPLGTSSNNRVLIAGLVSWAQREDDEFLDLIDGCLHLLGPRANRHQELSTALEAGASAWMVAGDHRSLTRRVGDVVQATYDAATSVEDEVTDELREAWAKAYGRAANASDAWDHAIKAVEDLLIPVVCPPRPRRI